MGIYQIIDWLIKFFSFAVHLLEAGLVLIVIFGIYYIVRTERNKRRKRRAARRPYTDAR